MTSTKSKAVDSVGLMGKSKKKSASDNSESASDSSDSESEKRKKRTKKHKERTKQTKERSADKAKDQQGGKRDKIDAADKNKSSPSNDNMSNGINKSISENSEHQSLVAVHKGGRRRNIRQAKTALESDEDNEAVSTSLEEAKLIQKARRRGMGVCWTAEDNQELDKEEQELKSVVHGSATGGLVSANAMTFQTKAEEVDEKVASAKAKFIEEGLDRLRMGDKNFVKRDEEEKKNKTSKKSLEDELYEIPAFLKQEKEEIEESGDRWLTGIAEVPLPMGVKLSNIERTEKAKQEHFLQTKGQVNLNVGTNISVNFKKNREDWVQQKKDESSAYQAALARKDGGQRESGSGTKASLPAPPSGFASDDKVLDRFVKRYKYK